MLLCACVCDCPRRPVYLSASGEGGEVQRIRSPAEAVHSSGDRSLNRTNVNVDTVDNLRHGRQGPRHQPARGLQEEAKGKANLAVSFAYRR